MGDFLRELTSPWLAFLLAYTDKTANHWNILGCELWSQKTHLMFIDGLLAACTWAHLLGWHGAGTHRGTPVFGARSADHEQLHTGKMLSASSTISFGRILFVFVIGFPHCCHRTLYTAGSFLQLSMHNIWLSWKNEAKEYKVSPEMLSDAYETQIIWNNIYGWVKQEPWVVLVLFIIFLNYENRNPGLACHKRTWDTLCDQLITKLQCFHNSQ